VCAPCVSQGLNLLGAREQHTRAPAEQEHPGDDLQAPEDAPQGRVVGCPGRSVCASGQARHSFEEHRIEARVRDRHPRLSALQRPARAATGHTMARASPKGEARWQRRFVEEADHVAMHAIRVCHASHRPFDRRTCTHGGRIRRPGRPRDPRGSRSEPVYFSQARRLRRSRRGAINDGEFVGSTSSRTLSALRWPARGLPGATARAEPSACPGGLLRRRAGSAQHGLSERTRTELRSRSP